MYTFWQTGDYYEFYSYLIPKILEDIRFHQIDDDLYLFIPHNKNQQTRAEFEKIIRKKLLNCTAEEFASEINSFASKKSELVTILTLETRKNSIWISDSEGIERLSGYSNRITAPIALKEVMMEALEPLSNQDLISEIKRRYPWINERNALNRCSDEIGVFPFSHLSKGMLKHIPIPEEKHKKLVSLIKDQLVQIGDQQFHTRDLLKRLPPEYNYVLMTSHSQHL